MAACSLTERLGSRRLGPLAGRGRARAGSRLRPRRRDSHALRGGARRSGNPRGRHGRPLRCALVLRPGGKPHERILRLGRAAGTMYVTCPSQIELYRASGVPAVRFLPQAADPAIDRPARTDAVLLPLRRLVHRLRPVLLPPRAPAPVAGVCHLQIRGPSWDGVHGDLPVAGGRCVAGGSPRWSAARRFRSAPRAPRQRVRARLRLEPDVEGHGVRRILPRPLGRGHRALRAPAASTAPGTTRPRTRWSWCGTTSPRRRAAPHRGGRPAHTRWRITPMPTGCACCSGSGVPEPERGGPVRPACSSGTRRPGCRSGARSTPRRSGAGTSSGSAAARCPARGRAAAASTHARATAGCAPRKRPEPGHPGQQRQATRRLLRQG